MVYTPPGKRSYEAMYAHTKHHTRALLNALQDAAHGDDAHTIHEALEHVSSDRLARYLAKALADR